MEVMECMEFILCYNLTECILQMPLINGMHLMS